MTFTVKITQDEDGIFCASVPSLKGCVSQGQTYGQAIANIKEAIALHLDLDVDEKIIVNLLI